MNPTRLVILAAENGHAWRVGVPATQGLELKTLDLATDVTPESVAQAIAAQREEPLPGGCSAVFAVPSNWCYSATIRTDNLPRGNRHRGLLYRLEEKLPMAVEEVTADFLVDKEKAWGVCLQTALLARWVQAFEDAGIAVEAICPTALLALQHCWSCSRSDMPQTRLIVLADEQGMDLLLFRDAPDRPTPPRDPLTSVPRDLKSLQSLWQVLRGKVFLPHTSSRGLGGGWQEAQLLAWRRLPPDHDALQQAADLCALELSSPPLLETFGLPNANSDELTSRIQACREEANASDSVWEMATLAGMAILAGHQRPIVNLRCGPLAVADKLRQVRRPLNRALVAAVIGLSCIMTGLLWRSHHYSAIAEISEARQNQLFSQLLPGHAMPLAIRPYLESEEHRLQDLAGQGANLPKRPSALLVLYETLRRLPAAAIEADQSVGPASNPLPGAGVGAAGQPREEVRYQLVEARFEPQEVFLDGQARSHGDADILATALRAHSGFQVDPPRTERLGDQGVGFSIRGHWSSASGSSPVAGSSGAAAGLAKGQQ